MSRAVRRTNDHLFNYINMAGTSKASEFRPLTQRQRTQIRVKTMIDPSCFVKAGLYAGIDQSKDKPVEISIRDALCEHPRPVFDSAHRDVSHRLAHSTKTTGCFNSGQDRVLDSHEVCGTERHTCAPG